jgi:hypothetical protein
MVTDQMSEPRGRGRPPLTPGDQPATVQVLVPSSDYDRAYDRSQRTGVSVPELLRRGLRRELADDRDE